MSLSVGIILDGTRFARLFEIIAIKVGTVRSHSLSLCESVAIDTGLADELRNDRGNILSGRRLLV